jgi:hypothetical protein
MLGRLVTIIAIVGLLAADAYLSFLFVFVLRMSYPSSHFSQTNAIVIALIVAWAAALIAVFWANANREFRLLLVATPTLILLGLYGYAMWLGLR